MKNIVFIGDIHGDYPLMEKIKKQFPKSDWRRIWVGDFVDSYVQDIPNQLACINSALSEEVVYGNHDWQYLDKKGSCSGRSNLLDTLLLPIKNDISLKFKHHIYIPQINTLVTHAGISQTLLDELKGKFVFDPKETMELEMFLRHNLALLIGKTRGGTSNCGGHLWCDWEEEFQPIQGINQVMGHTPIQSISFVPSDESRQYTNANIDCLERGYKEVLVWDGIWKVIKII